MTLALEAPRLKALPLAGLIAATRGASPALWRNMIALFLGLAACLLLMQVDHRTFNGINVWDKPAKFFLALAVQLGTVAFALQFVPASQRQERGIRFAISAMIFFTWAEAIYIVARAARAEASHFNYSSLFSQLAYSVMGFGAITLTFTAFYIGFRAWGMRGQGLLARATGLGLMLGMALGTFAGVYLGAQHSHWVGGELSDAHGLGFFSWSTTGGDLRVAHFVGLHAAQGVPLAALSGSRAVVYGVALLFIAATVFTFVQAVMGIPLFRA